MSGLRQSRAVKTFNSAATTAAALTLMHAERAVLTKPPPGLFPTPQECALGMARRLDLRPDLMEKHWLADRQRLQHVLDTHLEWTRQDLADATGRSLGWVKKWRKRLRAASASDPSVLLSRSCAKRPCQSGRRLTCLASTIENLFLWPSGGRPRCYWISAQQQSRPWSISLVRRPSSL